MKIFITGHLGFIGPYLTQELDKRKIPWVGYDLKQGEDTRDANMLDTAIEKCQPTHIIHLAALAGVRRGNKYPDAYISTNITGTSNIVNIAEDLDVPNLIFYSSSSVFGDINEPPVKETGAKEPTNIYGITKLAGEHIVRNSSIRHRVLIRPFTVYGENPRKDMVIGKWIEQYKSLKPLTVYGDGSSCRGYVYVRDLVKSTVDIVESGGMGCEDYNLGGSEVIYLRDILAAFDEVLPNVITREFPMPKEDIKSQYADTTKAKKDLGFNPKKQFITKLKKILNENQLPRP